MQIFDGRAHAKYLEAEILKSKSLSANSEKTLAIVQLGNTFATDKYADIKKKFCETVGIKAQIYKISEYLPDNLVENEITKIINDEENGGVIIQLPLPRTSLKSVLDLIPLNKDIDILSSKSIEQYNNGVFIQMPPVVRAFDYFIKLIGMDLQGVTAIVIGNGNLVGKPISVYLSKYGAKVEVLDDYKTGNRISGDIMIASTGVANLINGEDISEGCHVVDFGYSSLDGRVVGDVNLKSKLDHLGFLSPSPGGMGPLDVRFLIMNFLGI